MARGRPLAPLQLEDEDRQLLEGYIRRRKTAQQLALRARIVLGCAAGESNMAIAHRLDTTRETVGRWRKRFLESGIDGLHDEPRPGAPRTIDDEKVERIVTLTLEETPESATHWSTREMARRVGVSSTTVHRVWRAFRLQPHRSEGFHLSNDPLFVEKVRDIVGLYLNPPEHAVVLCVDEKPQIQALDRKHPRFHCHFTPTYNSWINQVERWFGLLSERKIKRGGHRSVFQLEKDIRSYIDVTNRDPRPFVWIKSADEILQSIRRFCERTARAHGIEQNRDEISETGH